MKRIVSILFLISIIFFTSCNKLVDVSDKPDVTERSVDFVVQVIDSTGTIKKVYGHDYVKGATVTVKSKLRDEKYTFLTDENGNISLGNLVSGEYLFSISKSISPKEMEIAYGEKKYQQQLVNSESTLFELRSDKADSIKISLDKLIVESTLVISEIYSCGPPEAGLYFHDKYIEIFNQSDEVQYLDGLLVAIVYSSAYTGENYKDDANYVHSSNIWQIPGKGTDYPIQPNEFAVCAEDGINHTINAEYSIDLSHVDFEFYKKDAPDIDAENVPNMKMIYQPYGYDWLIGGETDALVIAKTDEESLIYKDEKYLIPSTAILDGVEYLGDPRRLEKKVMYTGIDAGAAGGISFYTGKTLERQIEKNENGKVKLKDSNNSSLDFKVYSKPTPKYHNEIN